MLDPASSTVRGCGLSEYRFRQPHVLSTLRFEGPEEGEGAARDAAGDVGFGHFWVRVICLWGYRESRGKGFGGLMEFYLVGLMNVADGEAGFVVR